MIKNNKFVMNDNEMISKALEVGFANAAITKTEDIPFEQAFLVCCEDNSCGKFGKCYACPPDCGTPEDMKNRILGYMKALVLQTTWEINDPMDRTNTNIANGAHNKMLRALIDDLVSKGCPDGFMIGASGCSLCKVCAITQGKPCLFPDLKYSCMSAYCIFVQKLTERLGMEYDSGKGLVDFFGMYVFDKKE